MQNLTSLNVLVNNQPWPKYQLQQCDGADEDKVSHNAIQFQAPPPTNNEIENTLARIQQQYTTLASQLATQKTDQKSPEASGAPRLNQYPLV